MSVIKISPPRIHSTVGKRNWQRGLPLVLFVVAFILLWVPGCQRDSGLQPNLVIDSQSQEKTLPAATCVLFEKSYVNFAWGYTFRGLYILDNGEIYTYASTDKEIVYRQDIARLPVGSVKSERCLDLDTLAVYGRLIPEAAKGELSEPKQVRCDYGTIGFVAYIYYSPPDQYKTVLVYEDGDWVVENQSTEASRLHLWLLQMGDL